VIPKFFLWNSITSWRHEFDTTDGKRKLDLSPNSATFYPITSITYIDEKYGGITGASVQVMKEFLMFTPYFRYSVIDFHVSTPVYPPVPDETIKAYTARAGNSRHFVGQILNRSSSLTGNMNVIIQSPIYWFKKGDFWIQADEFTGTINEIFLHFFSAALNQLQELEYITCNVADIQHTDTETEYTVSFPEKTRLFDAMTMVAVLDDTVCFGITSDCQFYVKTQETEIAFTLTIDSPDIASASISEDTSDMYTKIYLQWSNGIVSVQSDDWSLLNNHALFITNTSIDNEEMALVVAMNTLRAKQSAKVQMDVSFYGIADANEELGKNTGWRIHSYDGPVKVLNSINEEITSGAIQRITYTLNEKGLYTGKPEYGKTIPRLSTR